MLACGGRRAGYMYSGTKTSQHRCKCKTVIQERVVWEANRQEGYCSMLCRM
jgi:hypothetical protein